MSRIDIVCAADERFTLPLVVTLRSVVSNCSRPVRAFVLHAGLSASTRRQIESAVVQGQTPPEVVWISAGEDYLRDAPRGLQHVSQAAYLRLAMGRLLPAELEKVIYLDSDLLVLKDLAPLWDIALDGNVLGAVCDFTVAMAMQHNPPGQGMQAAGITASDPIFNSGVLLVDLRAYREQNIEDQCVAFVGRWGSEIRYADQDALNAVLCRRWKRLDVRWNLQIGSLDDAMNHPSLSPGERQALAEVDPVILHFTGAAKPWNSGLRSLHSRAYVRYVQTTGWYGQGGFRFWQARRLFKCLRTAVVNRFDALLASRAPGAH